MKTTVHRYKAGDRVMLRGQEAVVESTGININRLPVYKIGEVWYFERELEDWYPPCPV